MTSPDKGRPKPSDSFFVQNHYIDHKSFGSIEPGTGVTVGDPGFKDPAFFDFRPGPGSVLRGRLAKPFTPGDAVGTERPQPAAIGAFE